MSKISIGIVSDFLPGSGVTSFLRNSFMKVDSSDVEYTAFVISGSTAMDPELSKMGWSIEHISPVREGYIKHLRDWKNALKPHSDLNVIYFNYSASWNVFPIYLAKTLTSAKIAVHSHNVYFGSLANPAKMRFLELAHSIGKRILHPTIDYRYAASVQAAKWMFPAKDVSSTRVLNNGVDLKKLNYSPDLRIKIRRKYSVSDTTMILGNVGVLEPRKNQMYLMDVLDDLLNRGLDANLWIFGDGSLRDKLQSRANTLGISSKVTFWGRRDDLFDFYQAMDVFLMPSTSEGLSVAYIEAQASGLPVIINSKLPVGKPVRDLVERVSISDGVDKWADAVQRREKFIRKSTSKQIKDNGYDSSDLKQQIEREIQQYKRDNHG